MAHPLDEHLNREVQKRIEVVETAKRDIALAAREGVIDHLVAGNDVSPRNESDDPGEFYVVYQGENYVVRVELL